MIDIDMQLDASSLTPLLQRMWTLSADKLLAIEQSAERRDGTPVFTVQGQYVAQGWTEWTQGFQFGSQLLQFDATADEAFLKLGRTNTSRLMPGHVTHFGVHDHGFNNVSTYGNLRRMMLEGRIAHDAHQLETWELALRCSGAVQASRWTDTAEGDGFIYSFNGPHSLFCDTIRSLRSLALAHHLGHCLMDENDEQVSLLERLVQHARVTAEFNVYYGRQRDFYDQRGRVAHESIFNVNDGNYRCPSTQQGYSPFSTWTRGQAWIISGYAELLEFLAILPDSSLDECGERRDIEQFMLEAARAASDHYLQHAPGNGVPYWDTGAPGLSGGALPATPDPWDSAEPLDSSAAAIAAQGLLRLGHYLLGIGQAEDGARYWQAGLTILKTLLEDPYLSLSADHQGLLLHSVYHRPRDWDHTPEGSRCPCGESSMWGDYHLREAAVYVGRVAAEDSYHCFFGPLASTKN